MQSLELKIPNTRRNQSKDLAPHDGLNVKYLNHHLERIKHIESLVSEIPDWDDMYFLHTRQSFNAFTFIPYIIKHKGKIDHLHSCTYSISVRVIESLQSLMLAGKIDKVNLVVSDSLIKRNPKTCELLNSIAANLEGWEVKYSWVHAKITLAKCGDDNFVIEGSGNWSENAQYEQYIFCNNPKVYAFRKKLLEEAKIRHEAK